MSGTAGGAVIVSTSGSAAVAAADNMANPTASQMLDYNFVYDGATWDRWQGTSVAGAGNVAEQLAPGAEDNTNGIYAYQWKPLAVSTYCPTRFVDFAANATLNVKATAGNVFSLACHNINGAARFIQLHNTATVPGGGAVPLFSFLVPTGAQTLVGTDFFTASGVNFSTGIAFAFSTTEGTYTAGVATDQFTTVLYK
jgi:hypothetical protein